LGSAVIVVSSSQSTLSGLLKDHHGGRLHHHDTRSAGQVVHHVPGLISKKVACATAPPDSPTGICETSQHAGGAGRSDGPLDPGVSCDRCSTQSAPVSSSRKSSKCDAQSGEPLLSNLCPPASAAGSRKGPDKVRSLSPTSDGWSPRGGRRHHRLLGVGVVIALGLLG
jgi:hypothetical protein